MLLHYCRLRCEFQGLSLKFITAIDKFEFFTIIDNYHMLAELMLLFITLSYKLEHEVNINNAVSLMWRFVMFGLYYNL